MELLTPFVSVIIPVFNDSVRLASCLCSLENQTYPKHLYEIIVVDNGSDEGVEEIVCNYGQARECYEGQPSSYAARNRGLSLAKGEIIAFTDADCLPSPDWIEKGVVNLLSIPGCGLVAGRVDIFFRDPERPTMVELYDGIRGLLQQKYVAVDGFGATANLFTFRSVFEKVGEFDTKLKSCGDLEWGRRVSSGGYKLVYSDDTCVAHPARQTFRQLYKKMVRVAGGWHDLNLKHMNAGKGGINYNEFYRTLISILQDQRLSTTKDKIKVVVVMLFVEGVKICERVRLNLGAGSKR